MSTSNTRTGYGGLQETETDVRISSVDFFTSEILEKSVVARKSCIVRPVSHSEAGPIFVNIPREGSSYIDPASFRVNCDFKVQKIGNDGNPQDLVAADNSDVAPINLFTKAFFKNVETSLNHKTVSLHAVEAYPIKAFLETALSYGRDAADGHLRCSFWHKDKPGTHNTMADDDFKARHKFISASREVSMCDTLHTELTTLNKYIPPGVDVQFRFIMNSPQFFLQQKADKNFKVSISDFYLSFDRVMLLPQYHREFEAAMAKENIAVFPITRGVVRSKQLNTGTSIIQWSQLYNGQLPEQIVICMLPSSAATGSKTSNLFNFQHFNVEEMQLMVNSVAIPAQPIKFNHTAGKVNNIRAFRHFFDNLGIAHGNGQCLINYEDFCNGATIIPFDLTADKCALYHSHAVQTGSIDLIGQFKIPLPEVAIVYALCTFNDNFYIKGPPENREVFVEAHVAG